jgi:hypothetical protein
MHVKLDTDGEGLWNKVYREMKHVCLLDYMRDGSARTELYKYSPSSLLSPICYTISYLTLFSKSHHEVPHDVGRRGGTKTRSTELHGSSVCLKTYSV